MMWTEPTPRRQREKTTTLFPLAVPSTGNLASMLRQLSMDVSLPWRMIRDLWEIDMARCMLPLSWLEDRHTD